MISSNIRIEPRTSMSGSNDCWFECDTTECGYKSIDPNFSSYSKILKPGFMEQLSPEQQQSPQDCSNCSDDDGADQVLRLMSQGYTRALAESVKNCKDKFPFRIWIIDNSASMNIKDGHMYDDSDCKKVKSVSCSRWEEIRDCIGYHVKLAETIQAPSCFRFLNPPDNGPEQFEIGTDGSTTADDAMMIMDKIKPHGATPLAQHIDLIYKEISPYAQKLRQSGKHVSLTIATDGLPTDSNGLSGVQQRQAFVESLKRLQELPVWLVVRLCTDDEPVVNFYNEIYHMMDISMDILDDFVGEAEEVTELNPWLNYTLPIHRLREMGFHNHMFDLLDERPLSEIEIGRFCQLLLDRHKFDETQIPDPNRDWRGFTKIISKHVNKEDRMWNPVYKRAKRWISLNKLKRAHRKGL